jgi:Domain of unknown function (DUF4258)
MLGMKNDNRRKQVIQLTDHAWDRMTQRSISKEAIDAAINFGRPIFTRKAKVYVIGKNEVSKLSSQGINLRDFEGIQVVCASKSGAVITTYRNHDFSGLRPRR